jgi:lysophospholipase L1-like esterase
MFGVIPDLTDPFWYATDGMHFNEAGHALLAAAWADTLRGYMRADYEQMNSTTATG